MFIYLQCQDRQNGLHRFAEHKNLSYENFNQFRQRKSDIEH